MEFINEIPDKKQIEKQETGINKFLTENNVSKIEQILQFFNKQIPFLLVNGFVGTGKNLVLNQAFSFLDKDVIILNYNCFETTILDDILLKFFETFKNLTAQNIIEVPKLKTENFTQKINAYFNSIQKPIVIVLDSFEQVLQINKQNILDFLSHIAKSYKIRIVMISRKFNYEDFKDNYGKIAISAFDKNIFEKFLRSEGITQIGPLSDELYKHTRGYYFYTTLSVKIMKIKNLSLGDFLSEHSKSFLSFNDFILREALSLVNPTDGHLIRFLTIIRHPVNINLLKILNLYDEERIKYFIENQIITKDGSSIYLQDYYKVISENSIAENIAVKIHKSCAELYKTQLPLKPFERDLMISRQTMRKEIEYHELFIPQKPAPIQKIDIEEPQNYIAQKEAIEQPKTKEEKDEQIKKISFVFDSEADEMAIMNKIALSINEFVDTSDKKQRTLDEMKGRSLIDLINLARKAEQKFDYQKVIMLYQQALTLNTDADFDRFLPTLYTQLARAYKQISDWFNATKYFKLAVDFYESTGDLEKSYENKYEMAYVYYMNFKSDVACDLLKEILNENLPLNLNIRAKLLYSDITGEWQIKELPQNIKELEKPLLAELYFKYALEFDKNENIEIAEKYYKKCVETSQDIKINKYLSSSLTNLASIYAENGNINSAIKYLHESIRLDELIGNYNGIYISSMKLANIYTINSPDKANDKLEYAKKCALELNDPFYVASCEVTLGDLCRKSKDYKNALRHYKEAYNLAIDNFTKDNLEKIEMRIREITKVYNEE